MNFGRLRGSTIVAVVFIVVSLYLALHWFNARLELDACTVEELAMHSERDFLMQLPQLLRAATPTHTLLDILKEKYPNTLIEAKGQDICWGNLLLKRNERNELLSVQEACE